MFDEEGHIIFLDSLDDLQLWFVDWLLLLLHLIPWHFLDDFDVLWDGLLDDLFPERYLRHFHRSLAHLDHWLGDLLGHLLGLRLGHLTDQLHILYLRHLNDGPLQN